MRVAANEKAEAEGYEAEPSYVYGLKHSVLEFSVKIPRTTSMNAADMDLVTQFLASIQFCFHPSCLLCRR
uniref:Uncharacterized protein n=1 Tax=Salix viminalis TaxID=40686 RepID=A0A6N2NL69_SALVM